MAKKKVIIKLKPEDEEELKSKSKTKHVVQERVKGKKSKKKAVAAKPSAAKNAPKAKDKKKAKAEKDIDSLSLEEVSEDLNAFDEEPSELEREVIASEKEFDEEIQFERIYTVPLAKGYMKAKNWKRTKKAVKVLREFVERHMKPEVLYISQEVNERIWEDGIKKPPRKIRIRCTKNTEGLVRVFLA